MLTPFQFGSGLLIFAAAASDSSPEVGQPGLLARGRRVVGSGERTYGVAGERWSGAAIVTAGDGRIVSRCSVSAGDDSEAVVVLHMGTPSGLVALPPQVVGRHRSRVGAVRPTRLWRVDPTTWPVDCHAAAYGRDPGFVERRVVHCGRVVGRWSGQIEVQPRAVSRGKATSRLVSDFPRFSTTWLHALDDP